EESWLRLPGRRFRRLFRWHLDDAHAIFATYRDLLRHVLVLESRALAHGQRDGRNNGDEQEHSRKFERINVVRVEHFAELGGIAVTGRLHLRTVGHVNPHASRPYHAHDLEYHDARNDAASHRVARHARAHGFDVDVEHHDHEQEQHHDCADVNQDEHDGQELRFDEQPDVRAGEEAQHQQHGRVHRVLHHDHAQRRHHEHQREKPKENLDQHAPYLSFIYRYEASAALSAEINAS